MLNTTYIICSTRAHCSAQPTYLYQPGVNTSASPSIVFGHDLYPASAYYSGQSGLQVPPEQAHGMHHQHHGAQHTMHAHTHGSMAEAGVVGLGELQGQRMIKYQDRGSGGGSGMGYNEGDGMRVELSVIGREGPGDERGAFADGGAGFEGGRGQGGLSPPAHGLGLQVGQGQQAMQSLDALESMVHDHQHTHQPYDRHHGDEYGDEYGQQYGQLQPHMAPGMATTPLGYAMHGHSVDHSMSDVSMVRSNPTSVRYVLPRMMYAHVWRLPCIA